MALSGPPTTWLNADGLLVKFGPTESVPAIVGSLESRVGGTEIVEVRLDLTTLSTSTTSILDHSFFIPSTAAIEKVEIEMITAATSGGAATFRLGAIKSDETTAIDATAFVNDIALASINAAGKLVTLTSGVTAAGTSIGGPLGTAIRTTTPAVDGLLTAKAGTAVYTAGLANIRIWLSYQSIDAILT